ncbi:tryptophan synthase subunit alpha [Caldimicrobium thiodismutans]|uniref:Tryptophan synthase alpha chain n=1 Tax=Caldimicrobium thiodismutans TaxID=1653476 RepID=A0A0U5AHX1_9BACT|nr:tryptophan synthase subunit alpha [Caldimicrobium thiodismutans]BAU23491.1 tryptophan synthase subunit alpha [Caldimicrobium thiodismutans]
MTAFGAKLVETRIRRLTKEGKVALIPYITAFDPEKGATLEFLRYLSEAEPACIELGFPFSDPVADGPTIQKAIVRALKNNPTFEEYLEMIARFKKEFPEIPIVCMTYYNILYRFGLERAVREALSSGLDGFIIPDLPMEEAGPWLKINKGKGLATVFLSAPTSGEERIRKIARLSKGFLYYVSLTGITGARESLPEDLTMRLQKIRKLLSQPLAVGFGISKPEHVRKLSPYADALIIGSALVAIIEREKKKAGKELKNFFLHLKNANS